MAVKKSVLNNKVSFAMMLQILNIRNEKLSKDISEFRRLQEKKVVAQRTLRKAQHEVPAISI